MISDDTSTITPADVDRRIKSCAEDLCDDNDTLDEAQEQVHETVDSLDWVIYHGMSRQVVHTLSANEEGDAFDRLVDMGTELKDVKGMNDLYSKLAYCALEARLTKAVETEWNESRAGD